MAISEYLREERIVLDFKAANKEEAIKKLAFLSAGSEDINDIDKFISDILERETLGTTGIGFNLALPHARTDAVKSFVITVGVSPEGVDFNSLDGEPAKLIFLMGTPKKDVQKYLSLLAGLTRLLKDEMFRTNLIEAKTAGQIIEYFKKQE